MILTCSVVPRDDSDEEPASLLNPLNHETVKETKNLNSCDEDA